MRAFSLWYALSSKDCNCYDILVQIKMRPYARSRQTFLDELAFGTLYQNTGNLMSTPDQSLLQDIHEINLSYLMLAQRLLRDDPASGMARLGINEDVAEILSSLSPAQLVRLASSTSVICGFRLNDYDMLNALTSDV